MCSYSQSIHTLTQNSKLLAIYLRLELINSQNMPFSSILEPKFDHAASKTFENTENVWL